MKGRFLFAVSFATCLCLFAAATVQAGAREITVSAAISLKNAFEDIGRLYESRQRAKVDFNFGASGDLARQIEGGAPVDVFASAAQKDMDECQRRGFIAAGSRKDFAGNSVVLIVPAGAKTRIGSFEGLASPGIGKIAVGNPGTVPAGRYAAEVLGYYNLSAVLRDRLVFTENVRQALDYVARDEVDAGIVYATDAAIRKKEVKVVASAPDSSHKPIVYPIAIVKGSQNSTGAREFIDLVLSKDGRRILARYGFKAVR